MNRKTLWNFCAVVLWPWLCGRFMWCWFMVTWWWLWLWFSLCLQWSCGDGLCIERLWIYKREKVKDAADRYGRSGGTTRGACLCVERDGYSWDGLERCSYTGVVSFCAGFGRGEYDRKGSDKQNDGDTKGALQKKGVGKVGRYKKCGGGKYFV